SPLQLTRNLARQPLEPAAIRNDHPQRLPRHAINIESREKVVRHRRTSFTTYRAGAAMANCRPSLAAQWPIILQRPCQPSAAGAGAAAIPCKTQPPSSFHVQSFVVQSFGVHVYVYVRVCRLKNAL